MHDASWIPPHESSPRSIQTYGTVDRYRQKKILFGLLVVGLGQALVYCTMASSSTLSSSNWSRRRRTGRRRGAGLARPGDTSHGACGAFLALGADRSRGDKDSPRWGTKLTKALDAREIGTVLLSRTHAHPHDRPLFTPTCAQLTSSCSSVRRAACASRRPPWPPG